VANSRLALTPTRCHIVADVDGDLAGYVELIGGSFRRSRATAYLVMGWWRKRAARVSAPRC